MARYRTLTEPLRTPVRPPPSAHFARHSRAPSAQNALDNVSNRPGGASGTQAALTSAMDPFRCFACCGVLRGAVLRMARCRYIPSGARRRAGGQGRWMQVVAQMC